MAEKIKSEKKVKESKSKTKKIKKEPYMKQVRKELKLVKWATGKDVLKYTISTLIFCLFVCLFFMLLNFGLSCIKGLFV